ncbi:hypothetical protein RM549_15800 [Salegentibacter sp. F188]|uniref:Uncharacterized protein n=1 Tax=Autumnicola patrickiae TaxID=3075591 RepID=A0ABU3E5P2_9FLAO|nr:hypothetical protein [Salegentibacter sp. F188]MDT0691260.1 hypothetical protein [Salegentibacter sp. F188]
MMLLDKNENSLPKRVKEISTDNTGNFYFKFSLADARNSDLEFVGSREDFEELKNELEKLLK